MKKILQISLSVIAASAVVVCFVLINSRNSEIRRGKVCTGIDVVVLDSASLGFVTKEDVLKTLREAYGQWIGQKLDSVKLRRIEDILGERNAVREVEAYTTPDGILHIEMRQREPVLRFVTPAGSFYSDAQGLLFPVQPNYTAKILTVQGGTPIMSDNGFKGIPPTAKERNWIRGLLAVEEAVNGDKFWKSAIGSIRSSRDGSLELVSSHGKEVFLFGCPDNIKAKFEKMENYYRYIRPTKQEGWYKTVDVRYEGQVVCRK